MRTVGTKLTVEASQAKRELRATGDEVGDLVDELQKAARNGDLTAKAVARVGETGPKAMAVTEKATARLNNEIAETVREIKRLDRAFRDTGDVTLLKDLDKQFRRLRGQIKGRDMFGADEAARGFALSFQERVGPLIARLPLSGPMVTVLGGATAAAAPVVSSLIGAAISGGAALGAVGIGTALVAQRPEVQKAGTQLGQHLMASLVSDASPMVRPVLAGIATIERRFDGMRGSIRNIFEDSATFVGPLVEGVADAANEIVGSLENVVDGAGPVVDVIGNHRPKVAAAAGDALEAMGEGGARSAAMLATAMTAVEGTIRLTAGTLSLLNKAVPFLFGHLMFLNDAIDGSGDAAESSTFDLNEFLGGLNATASAATTTAGKIRTLDEAFNQFVDGATSAFNAETRFGEALDEISAKANRNSAGLDTNTRKGRENRGALAALARQTRESAAAVGAMSGGQQRANGIMDRGYAAFLKAARGMGISEQAARELASALGLIRSKTVTITTRYVVRGGRNDGSIHVSGPGGSGTQVRRWGGITQHAQTGLLREAAAFSPGTRYAFAEPATGGEAFIPRYGNFERSLGIWAKVGRDWLGGRPGAGGGVVRVIWDLRGADSQMAKALRQMVRIEGGGNVQVAFGTG